jgi:hypothetical protein
MYYIRAILLRCLYFLKTDVVGYSEIFVSSYQTTYCHMPRDSNLHVPVITANFAKKIPYSVTRCMPFLVINIFSVAEFEIATTAIMMRTIFWDITLCSLSKVN